ncbi:MAG: Hvo_1808 family surface protein, partial [Haloferacaceae archaeon]
GDPAASASVRGDAGGAPDRRAAARPDPATDRIGWEAGYWHDDPIDVDQSDGLSERELDAYVARSMARVEFIRRAEFTRRVPVEVIDREAYRRRAGGDNESAAFVAWNNQVWEALFVDGEDSNVQERLGRTIGSSVRGFYTSGEDEIRIVTDTPSRPVIDNATLVHELTHALQDQTVDLTRESLRRDTQDGDLAADGLVEGEANLVQRLYERRCGEEWECVGTPAPRAGGSGGGGGSGSGSGGSNLGILLTILHPYSDGPVYVNAIRERAGWDGVRAAFDDPPASTEQVIHRTDEAPTPIRFEDRARGDWRPYPDEGENGSDTAGEASIYVMLWYQAQTANADTVDPGAIGRTSSPFDIYNYDARPSAGWANDRLFPYRDGPPGGNDTRHGYVWVTEWDTERDAREFRRAYGAILDARDARARDDGIRVIEDGPFADAFLVVRRGTRVTVVNGPTPAAVEALRPGLAAAARTDGGSGAAAPGFGVRAALVALLAGAGAALARRRG